MTKYDYGLKETVCVPAVSGSSGIRAYASIDLPCGNTNRFSSNSKTADGKILCTCGVSYMVKRGLHTSMLPNKLQSGFARPKSLLRHNFRGEDLIPVLLFAEHRFLPDKI